MSVISMMTVYVSPVCQPYAVNIITVNMRKVFVNLADKGLSALSVTEQVVFYAMELHSQ